ncbi:hypothetical protein [Paraburkholderia sp. MM5477-R1]|uniref:hypothetical protein n=1 Tax=Paraburkholderia sp. MM5477-R1 TaxID=2991062 RepID=UPI003D1F57E9
MDGPTDFQLARCRAAATANVEDAALWRWFSALLEERRIRWCLSGEGWLVSVDHRHLATSASFDLAMREAKTQSEMPRATRSRSKNAVFSIRNVSTNENRNTD